MSAKKRKHSVKRTGGRKRRPIETALPAYLPGATEFTADPVMNNPDWVVQTLNALEQQGALPAGLFDETLFDEGEGRHRMKGNWLKVLCAYVASKKPAMETFWNDYGQNPLWSNAGFAFEASRDHGFEYRPSFDSFYRRAIEREADEIIDRFERAADQLIQLARSYMPEIGKNVAIDSTLFMSPSRLYHVCKPGKCPRDHGDGKKRTEAATVVDAMSALDAEAARHEEAASEPPVSPEEERAQRLGSRTWVEKDKKGREWRYRYINGCLYRCLDVDAGVRSYDGKRATVGGYDQGAIDMCTGGTLATVMFSASRQERAGIPALMRKVERALGGDLPETVGIDRGFGDDKTYRFLTRRGVVPIGPWRKPNRAVDKRWKERAVKYDEYGDPRCKYCGGPVERTGDGLGFMFDHGEPVIRFRCLLAHTDECRMKTQQIRCSENWRLLIGLPRHSERYMAVRSAHKNMERTFAQQRRRFGVAGKDETGRLKRRGMDVHRLRAAIARFLEWLYICLRHGWIGSHRYRNIVHTLNRTGRDAARRLINRRFAYGLMLPYGPKAYKLGLAATPEIPSPKKKDEPDEPDPDDDDPPPGGAPPGAPPPAPPAPLPGLPTTGSADDDIPF